MPVNKAHARDDDDPRAAFRTEVTEEDDQVEEAPHRKAIHPKAAPEPEEEEVVEQAVPRRPLSASRAPFTDEPLPAEASADPEPESMGPEEEPMQPKAFRPNMNQNVNPNPQPSFSPRVPSSGVYASHRNNSGGNKLHLLILVIFGLLVIGATVYLLKGGGGFTLPGGASATPAPSAVALATPSPISTPEPSMDRSKFTVRVLNGSGKTGLAGTVADKLKALGYKVERTGNATNSAFAQTLVRTKLAGTDLQTQLTKDLSPDLSASASSGLKDSDASDAEIIIGLK